MGMEMPWRRQTLRSAGSWGSHRLHREDFTRAGPRYDLLAGIAGNRSLSAAPQNLTASERQAQDKIKSRIPDAAGPGSLADGCRGYRPLPQKEHR